MSNTLGYGCDRVVGSECAQLRSFVSFCFTCTQGVEKSYGNRLSLGNMLSYNANNAVLKSVSKCGND